MEKNNYNKRNDNRQRNLPVWSGGMMAPDWRTNLCDRSPFIVTGPTERNELGDCVIMTRWPFIVCKIHRFETNATQRNGDERTKAFVARRTDEKRCNWLIDRSQAWRTAYNAEQQGISVREYVEQDNANSYDPTTARHYDEEFDEPRIIGKVPGMNVYLEVYGSMFDVGYDSKDLSSNTGGKVATVTDIRKAVSWACSFLRGYMRKPTRIAYATHEDDYQPLERWHEEYAEDDDRMFIPKEQGIGHTAANMDPERRGDRHVRHQLNNEEKEEYNRLKAESANSSSPRTLAQLERQAVANVAARHLLDDKD